MIARFFFVILCQHLLYMIFFFHKTFQLMTLKLKFLHLARTVILHLAKPDTAYHPEEITTARITVVALCCGDAFY